MSKSVEKTDWLGNKYTAHYDDDGSKTGESWEKKDWLGDEYTEHRDSRGEKVGESWEKKDWLSDEYTEHRDSRGEKVGESWEKKDWLSDEYTEHRDSRGEKVGESRERKDWLGDEYIEHTGSAFKTTRSSSEDDDREESRPSDQEETSSEPSYPSTEYGGASSGGTSSGLSGGLIVGVCVVIGLLLLAIKGPTPQSPAVINGESQRSGANGPTPTYTQPRDNHFFENTVPGTSNMGQAQPNRLEAENQGLISSSEQSSVPTPLPADPPTVRCILSTGVETLISGTECHERSGTIYTGERLTW
jgi:hypothetical protein